MPKSNPTDGPTKQPTKWLTRSNARNKMKTRPRFPYLHRSHSSATPTPGRNLIFCCWQRLWQNTVATHLCQLTKETEKLLAKDRWLNNPPKSYYVRQKVFCRWNSDFPVLTPTVLRVKTNKSKIHRLPDVFTAVPLGSMIVYRFSQHP